MAPSPRSTSPLAAAKALASDHLVALPTETVYGLGGLASSPAALTDIFRVKGRPADHPVIVHVSGAADIAAWSDDAPATAYAIAETFWPGPITVVVPKSPAVLNAVTGGQSTVALRSPAHPLFQDVLAELSNLGVRHPGIAAPSANRFGRVSPTTAEHVRAELGEFLSPLDLILDGGASTVGVESTIVLCGADSVSIARPGGISAAAIDRVVPLTSEAVVEARVGAPGPRVPGSLAAHYAPTAQVYLLDPAAPWQISDLADQLGRSTSVGVLGISPDIEAMPSAWIRLPIDTFIRDSDDYARVLYSALRQADQLGLNTVVALAPPASSGGLAPAVRDRLDRAAVGSNPQPD